MALFDVPLEHIIHIIRYHYNSDRFPDLKPLLYLLNDEESAFLLDGKDDKYSTYSIFYDAITIHKNELKIENLRRITHFAPARILINIILNNIELLETDDDPHAQYYNAYFKKDSLLMEKAAAAGSINAMSYCLNDTTLNMDRRAYWQGMFTSYTMGYFFDNNNIWNNINCRYIMGREIDRLYDLWKHRPHFKDIKNAHITYKTVTENARRAALFVMHSIEFCYVKDIRRLIAKIIYKTRGKYTEEWSEGYGFTKK